jgi:hypothetical protein
MPVHDRLTGRMRPIRIRRVTGISLGSLRQIAKPQPLPLPWTELAPREHAPLPVKGSELRCSTRRFVRSDVRSVMGPPPLAVRAQPLGRA